MSQENENKNNSEVSNIASQENGHKKKPEVSKKQKDEERRKRNKEYQEAMKADPKYRGLVCYTKESFGMVQLSIQGEYVLKALRAGLYNSIDPGTADPLFRSYNDGLLLLEATIRKGAEASGHENYKCPQYIALIKETHKLTPEVQVMVDRIEKMEVQKPKKVANQ